MDQKEKRKIELALYYLTEPEPILSIEDYELLGFDTFRFREIGYPLSYLVRDTAREILLKKLLKD